MAERKYKHPQVNLRMPEELKEKVSQLAIEHGRSANAEMVAALEAWVLIHSKDQSEESFSGVSVRLKKDEMRFLIDSVQQAVVSQLVKKYNFAPKK